MFPKQLRVLFVGTLVLLAGVGLYGMYLKNTSPRVLLAPDQGGIALTENSKGELEIHTGERNAERTLPPAQPNLLNTAANAHELTEEEWLTRFELIERSGEKIHSDGLKGQPYVAGFFFTVCPSICVKQNEKVRQLQEEFADRPIRFVSISVDPEHDQPDILREYAKRFDANDQQWLFFTGEMDYISRVGAEVFGLGVFKQGHPEKFALMDANGKLFGLYSWSDSAQWSALRRDITKLLDAGGSAAEPTEKR